MAIKMRLLVICKFGTFFSTRKGKKIEATATGCAFNLRAIAGSDRGRPMSKAWHVKSTLPLVARYLDRCCTCPPHTVHAQAKGPNTTHTGRYTPEFVSSVHRMFALHVWKSAQEVQENSKFINFVDVDFLGFGPVSGRDSLSGE